VSYPFAPIHTFGEFLDKTKALGVKESLVDGSRYLRRGDGAIVFLPPDIQPTDLLQLAVISSWCRVLDIAPETFGFDAGFLQDPLSAWDWE
jgi:hypothetical protein